MTSPTSQEYADFFEKVFTGAEADVAGMDVTTVSNAISYNGFNAKEFAYKNRNLYESREKRGWILKLIQVVVERGTKEEKLSMTMSAEGKKILNDCTVQLGLSWKLSGRNPDTITPSRILLAFPYLTVMALEKIPKHILSDFPWMFGHSAINSLIKANDYEAKKTSVMASSSLSNVINKREAGVPNFIRAMEFCIVGFKSDMVTDAQKDQFWARPTVTTARADIVAKAELFDSFVEKNKIPIPEDIFG